MKGITKLKGIEIAATMLLAALLIAAISVPTVWADDPTDTSQQHVCSVKQPSPPLTVPV